ncbi:MAG: hypothetical protein IJ660_01625 [Alphaproteobacteria bacterium]|nr:hypothetical protein [Alphaproteobacteria bacterium]
MIKKWLKILPIVCLFAAQVIVAVHIHDTNDVLAEQDCFYCQTATELASADTPEVLTLNEPIYYTTDTSISLFEHIAYFNLINHYDTRAPPQA